MTKESQQHFNSRNDRLATARASQQNSLAIISLILSIVAVCISMIGGLVNKSLEARKVRLTHYESGDASVIADKAGNAITFLEQVVVFIVSKVASIPLSLTAAIIGLVALARPRNVPAIIGIALSTFSILATFR